MHTVVVRLWLPDRPGALGQVASRIGAVKGDVIGFDILERGAGRVIDELVVRLASPDVIELLTKEIDAVDGVSVEHVRQIDGERADPGFAALALGADVAEADHAGRLMVLLEGLVRVTEAEWAVAERQGRVVAAAGSPPDKAWLLAFIEGSGHLDGTDTSAPRDILLARMARSSLTIAAGRADRPVHEGERVRMSLLVRIADTLIGDGEP